MRRLGSGTAAAAACVLVAAGAAVADGTRSAGRAEPRLTVQDAGPVLPAALAANLLPGATRRGCLTVGHASGGPAQVGLYAAAVSGSLAPHLQLVVRRGPATATPGSCAGFVAEATLYEGRLTDLPVTPEGAVADPRSLAPAEASSYRFELTLADAPEAAGRSADWDFGFASRPAPGTEEEPGQGSGAPGPEPEPEPDVQDAPGAARDPRPGAPGAPGAPGTPGAAGAPGATPGVLGAPGAVRPGTRDGAGSPGSAPRPAPCRSLALPAGRRSLSKPLRFGTAKATRATLRLRGTRLVVGAGGRAQHRRRGAGRWIRVSFAIEDRVQLLSRRAPFRVRVAPEQLTEGRTAVRVTVSSRRHALRAATFTVIADAGPEGRCTLR